MKRIKKNQVIITALAIMIAVAGYINYAGNITDIISVSGRGSTGSVDTASESKDSEIQVPDEEPDDESMLEPGSVILTSGGVASGVISEAKLNREQIRAKNKETLMNLINSTSIDEAAKQQAIQDMIKLTEVSEKENAAETLLMAKGFSDPVVSITKDKVDVVINAPSITDPQRAQIEDIVKRKAEVGADQIIITLLNMAE